MSLFTDLFGGGEQKVKLQSQTQPWKPATDILETILGRAEHRMRHRPFEAFPGALQAPQTPAEAAAMQSYMNAANLYGQYIPEAFGFQLQAPNIAENPVYQQMSEAIQSQVNRNLSENILPQITANQVAGGGFGTRGEVAQGIAARGTADVLAERLAGLAGTMYGQGLQAQQGALAMAPQIFGTQAALYGGAGNLQRAEQQRQLSEEQYRHQFAQMEPWQRMQMAYGFAGPLGQAFGQGQSRQATIQQPSIMQAIGGGLGLAGLGAGIFGGGGGSPTQFGYPGMTGGGLTTGPYVPQGYVPPPTYGPYGFGGMRPY